MRMPLRILVTLCICGLLLLPALTIGPIETLDDYRFVSSEEMIGKTQLEVEQRIGAIHSTGQCFTVTSVKGKLTTFSGEEWVYRISYNNGEAALTLCFVKGYVVFEQAVLEIVGENGRQGKTLMEVLDHRLLRKIIDRELDRPEWVDPDSLGI